MCVCVSACSCSNNKKLCFFSIFVFCTPRQLRSKSDSKPVFFHIGYFSVRRLQASCQHTYIAAHTRRAVLFATNFHNFFLLLVVAQLFSFNIVQCQIVNIFLREHSCWFTLLSHCVFRLCRNRARILRRHEKKHVCFENLSVCFVLRLICFMSMRIHMRAHSHCSFEFTSESRKKIKFRIPIQSFLGVYSSTQKTVAASATASLVAIFGGSYLYFYFSLPQAPLSVVRLNWNHNSLFVAIASSVRKLAFSISSSLAVKHNIYKAHNTHKYVDEKCHTKGVSCTPRTRILFAFRLCNADDSQRRL